MRSKIVPLLTILGLGFLLALPSLATPRTINLPADGYIQTDDDVPDVTDRVARISYIDGDVQVRRSGTEEWEKAALNLPLVEGDEVVTGDGARLEIQFDKVTHLRMDEGSYLKIEKLITNGIAVSLPRGTVSIRTNEFDKDREYFEIDAPKTTMAIQRSGMYRIDAGRDGSSQVRVTATEDGQARIYSETSGFTLKDGRSAMVYIDGPNAGEWDTEDAARYADAFDTWALDRDRTIAASLQNAYYDKYYDDDMYGAEDLNGNGEWIYTRNYGYVWRPYRTSIASYSNWSPYRYGQWRWVPPYGWTWINDEPWGWATYHYGRWFYDNGFWYWSPYGYYRPRHSWWSPALVIITTYANNICWYPLPYSYAYYNYNYHYHWNSGHHGGNHGGHGGNGTGPTPTPTPPVVATNNGPGFIKIKKPPLGEVPLNGVVMVKKDEFATDIRGTKRPPTSIATAVLTKVPADVSDAPQLPSYDRVKSDLGPRVKATPPTAIREASAVRTGAMVRKDEMPLDNELRDKRILGGRDPIRQPNQPVVTVTTPDGSITRPTGVVVRKPPSTSPPVRQPPQVVQNDRKEEPIRQAPQYTPPKQQEPVRQPPVYTPPTRTETPRTPPPKSEPPTRQPPRSDPPPSRNDSKPSRNDSKPSKPSDSGSKDGGKKKDG